MERWAGGWAAEVEAAEADDDEAEEVEMGAEDNELEDVECGMVSMSVGCCCCCCW